MHIFVDVPTCNLHGKEWFWTHLWKRLIKIIFPVDLSGEAACVLQTYFIKYRQPIDGEIFTKPHYEQILLPLKYILKPITESEEVVWHSTLPTQKYFISLTYSLVSSHIDFIQTLKKLEVYRKFQKKDSLPYHFWTRWGHSHARALRFQYRVIQKNLEFFFSNSAKTLFAIKIELAILIKK